MSHDRRLLDATCERLLVIAPDEAPDAEAAGIPFEGGYSAWRAAVAGGWDAAAELARLSAAVQPAHAPDGSAFRAAIRSGGAPPPALILAADRPAAALTRQRRASARLSKDAYRRRRRTVEADLVRLGLRRRQIELALTDPAVQASYVELRRLTSELADVEAALAAAEEAWLSLEELAPR